LLRVGVTGEIPGYRRPAADHRDETLGAGRFEAGQEPAPGPDDRVVPEHQHRAVGAGGQVVEPRGLFVTHRAAGLAGPGRVEDREGHPVEVHRLDGRQVGHGRAPGRLVVVAGRHDQSVAERRPVDGFELGVLPRRAGRGQIALGHDCGRAQIGDLPGRRPVHHRRVGVLAGLGLQHGPHVEALDEAAVGLAEVQVVDRRHDREQPARGRARPGHTLRVMPPSTRMMAPVV
jgi:hypothetical protein